MSVEAGLFVGGYVSDGLVSEMAKFQQQQVGEMLNAQRLRSDEAPIHPHLAVVLTGYPGSHSAFPANNSYARRLEAFQAQSGVKTTVYTVEKSGSAATDLISELNEDPHIHGIIPMFPEPWAQETEMRQAINTGKDVDGVNPDSPTTPATPQAMILTAEVILGQQLTADNNVGRIAVVGNGSVVGGPLAESLRGRGLQVELFGSRQEIAKGIPELQSFADIVFTAIPVARCIRPEHLRKGSVVIDVGYGVDHGTAYGNVDPAVYSDPRIHATTAFRHGVGPVTAALIHQRTLNNAFTYSDLPLPKQSLTFNANPPAKSAGELLSTAS